MRKKNGKFGWIEVPRRWERSGWPLLLRTWAQLIEQCEDPTRAGQRLGDVAYWYGERALNGLLAAAAWQQRNAHWFALEEFLGKRHVDPNLRKRRKSAGSGRGDLWLGLHVTKSEAQHGFTIEAKQNYTGQDPTEIVRAIEDRLSNARMQLRRLGSDFRWGYPMAVCYHIPALAPQSAKEWTPKIFDEVADALMEHANTIIAALWHPLEKAPIDEEWTFPGVLLVGRVYRSLPGGRGMPSGWKGKLER